MRYEYFGALGNKGFEVNDLVLSSTPGLQMINSKFALVNHYYPTTPDAIAPKFGFTWQPRASEGKIVFRGGSE